MGHFYSFRGRQRLQVLTREVTLQIHFFLLNRDQILIEKPKCFEKIIHSYQETRSQRSFKFDKVKNINSLIKLC